MLKTQAKRKRILVVDDSAAVRGFFEEVFSRRNDYVPEFASSGKQAVEKLKLARRAGDAFDFVLTDINMPGMDGFETLERMKAIAPDLKIGMITGFNVDDYIKMALEKGVYNIICKMDPPNEIIRTVDNLITGEGIFGIENHLESGAATTKHRILNTRQLKDVVREILDFAKDLLDEEKLYGLKTGLVEMGTNAIYHAYGYEKGSEVQLKESENVVFEYGTDSSKMVVDIVDESGILTKEKVLAQLHRGLNPTPEDLLAAGGRGIFLTRFLCDKVVVNIEKEKRTEVLLIMYLTKDHHESKPLLINQV
ncbi:MAG: response regulator [bacterium]